MYGGGKKRKGSFGGGGKKGGGGAAGKNAEPTEEELQAMAEEVEAEAMEEDGDGEGRATTEAWLDGVVVRVGMFFVRHAPGCGQLAERMLCCRPPSCLQTRRLASACSGSCSTTRGWTRYSAPCCARCAACCALRGIGSIPCQPLLAGFHRLAGLLLHSIVALFASVLQTAMRTEPLGLDRHCRRYWWLYCDPGFLFVEEPDGQRIGVITSKEQLDEVGAGAG